MINPYDHHTKAGNRGDVVKHVALIAALRSEWAIPQAATGPMLISLLATPQSDRARGLLEARNRCRSNAS